MLIQEPHCRGFEQLQTQTVSQYLADQEVETYNQFNDLLLEIISLKNRLKPGPLGIRDTHLFTLALYDLDHFKVQVQNNHLLQELDLPAETRSQALSDDSALLHLGHRWIKKVLFGC